MCSSLRKVYTPDDYDLHFDASAYLHYYFNNETLRDGARLSLFALPNMASAIRESVRPEKRKRLVDVGCGPVPLSAICFRDIVEEVHLSDYSSDCRHVLKSWLRGTSEFCWDAAIQKIARSYLHRISHFD